MACKAKGNVAAKPYAMPKGVTAEVFECVTYKPSSYSYGHMTISLTLLPTLKKRAHELFNEVAYVSYLGLASPKRSGGRSKILIGWLGLKTL